jgi:hypothetical protein
MLAVEWFVGSEGMRVRAAVAAVVTAFAVGAATASAAPAAAVVSAKSCNADWTHAVIGGAEKCLRSGQFCSLSLHREYHRYRYHCHRPSVDSRGRYHLTR